MTNEKKTLPDEGYYKIVILDANIYPNKNQQGRHLKIAFDIVGPEEYNGYFDFEFKNQSTEDNHWHGFFYVSIPNRIDGYCSYGDVTKKYKEFMCSLKESNPEYVFDGKLSTLRGLRLGAYIATQPYERSNGSVCQIKKVTKICSVNEYYLNRCEDALWFLF